MIRVTVLKDQNNYQEFSLVGHAGFDVYGKDIVCAAVSMLVINTINSISSFTEDDITVTSDEKAGVLTCKLPCDYSHDTELLIEAMLLGLSEVSKEYGSEFITLTIKEV
ncbi:MAG: ribosomal-processing cysteine protease Prp [Lachnospiraceae bacterium]|nr:ribosomal-processing cysteine protease Prp [Lachnospiraceae bacterium]